MDRRTGSLQLVMKKKKGKTVPESVFFQGALKVMRPLYLDDSGQACYIVLNPGGGYVDGDTYKMDVRLQEGAELILTTQSATKVYKTPKEAVYQENSFTLQAGSLLEYRPDPLIAYRGASYYQNSVIRMASRSALIYADIVTSGWPVDHQPFPYQEIRLKNQIYIDGQLTVLDHLKLRPGEQPLGNMGFMEGFTHFGTLFMIAEATENDFEALTETLYSYHDTCKIGFSRLDVPGAIVRVLGNDTGTIETVFAVCTEWMKKKLERKMADLRKY